MDEPYHPGELAVQRAMRQSESAKRVGRIINREIPPQAASFLAAQPMVVIAAADDAGRMWTSPITGAPGFAHAEGPRTIVVDAVPVAGDPLADALRRPRQVGMIALQPQLRRRMRVNGSAQPIESGVRIHTDQVYSNCPKYISRREIAEVRVDPDPPQARRSVALDDRQQRAITAADTFFIGSADAEGHADASHRGGNPGFLEVPSPTRLRWADYPGNSMFMTLGNIHDNPKCGLLILDWATGAAIQLTGTAEILWEKVAFEADPRCSVDFTMTEVVELSGASPLRWGIAELSPANPA